MKYYVEDWETDEVIKAFETNEDREVWLRENVDESGYLEDGRRISIYEI